MLQKPPLFYAEMLLSDQYKNVPKRLQLYLQLKPRPDVKFYCLLRRLPEHERREAVLDIYVQENIEKSVRRKLSTFLFLLDFFIIVTVIGFFGVAVSRYNAYLFGDDNPCSSETSSCTINQYPNYMVISEGSHFLVREVIRIISFSSSGNFKTWWSDPWKLVDMMCIIIILVFPTLMLTEKIDRDSGKAAKEAFRSLSTLAAGFYF